MKQRRFAPLALKVASALALLAIAIVILLPKSQPPLTPEAVVRRVANCYAAEDFGCIWDLASDSERGFLTKEAYVKGMKQTIADNVSGKLTLVGTQDANFDSVGTYSTGYIVRDGAGKHYVLPLQASPSGDGVVAVDIVFPMVLAPFLGSDSTGQIVPLDGLTVRNKLAAAKYGKSTLEPMGLKGAVTMGGRDRLTPWDELITRFKTVEERLSKK